MPNGTKHKRHKMATHKRKKRLRLNRGIRTLKSTRRKAKNKTKIGKSERGKQKKQPNNQKGVVIVI